MRHMCGLTRAKDEVQGAQSGPCGRLAAADITWWRSENVRMRSRYLNPGEVICVSVKKVKSVFKGYNATFISLHLLSDIGLILLDILSVKSLMVQ